ncbi:2-keto-4-pentenoate hydratase [Acinetobacter sp. LoGeW2-3]|uniref:2-keto-4-pentenoate hydratase n=1 Tax=Acinetobacter sp. LoGeW2-3 TaxID=1808001 RepID=UPI000C05C7CD|nr:fumarylacetoacetate hydrolase family protein [Acinetobacter sp. LoGeW2-3]ATO20151.1 2-keto-4-pentenoate hydratase [Acinetobacter sp. LoGeW2-3]
MLENSQRLADLLASVDKDPIEVEIVKQLLISDAEVEAYAIQARNIEKQLQQNATVTGKKIGLTNPKVQQQLGVDQPDFGVLLNHMDLSEESAILAEHFIQPKIEAELAFLIKKNIEQPIQTIEEMQQYISYVIPSFEIVDSRIQDWKIRFVDTVADNASSAAYVLSGERKAIAEVDCATVKMTLTQNGELVSQGSGLECLGNPLNAAMWLVNKMLSLGTPVQAGEIILSGALGPMVNVKAGDEFETQIDGFAPLKVKFI